MHGMDRLLSSPEERETFLASLQAPHARSTVRCAKIKVTASGGARTIDDLRSLKRETTDNVDSAIIGRALYEKTIDLAEAIKELSQESDDQFHLARGNETERFVDGPSGS